MYESEMIDTLLTRIEGLAAENGKLRSELNAAEDALEEHQCSGKSKNELCNQLIEVITLALTNPHSKIKQLELIVELTGVSMFEATDVLKEAWKRAGLNWDTKVCESY